MGHIIDVKFLAVFGNEIKVVHLSEPRGAGGQYHVDISAENFAGSIMELKSWCHHGSISKIDGQWRNHLNSKSSLTITEFEMLCNILDSI